MGEYPELSQEDIAAIAIQRLVLESGVNLDQAVVTIEHLGT